MDLERQHRRDSVPDLSRGSYISGCLSGVMIDTLNNFFDMRVSNLSLNFTTPGLIQSVYRLR